MREVQFHAILTAKPAEGECSEPSLSIGCGTQGQPGGLEKSLVPYAEECNIAYTFC